MSIEVGIIPGEGDLLQLIWKLRRIDSTCLIIDPT